MNILPSETEWEVISTQYGWARRERECVRLVLTGVPRKVAAYRLGIAQSSVQTYMRRAMRKTCAEDIVELIWKVVAARDRLRAGRVITSGQRTAG